MEVRAFKPADLYAIAVQHQQSEVFDSIKTPGYGESLQAAGPAFTAVANGEVVACAGVIVQWASYSRAWAVISMNAGPYMTAITRNIRRWLKFNNTGRIDCAVDCGFDAAVRWASLLGFEQEGRMRRYTPEGRDCFLYAQVT
jgi:hypothetical protein